MDQHSERVVECTYCGALVRLPLCIYDDAGVSQCVTCAQLDRPTIVREEGGRYLHKRRLAARQPWRKPV